MIANSTHSRPQPYSSFKGLLLAGSAVLSLVTAPATVDIYATHPGLAWHNAQAMGGGGGNGGGHGGGGSGGGHGGGAGNGPGGGGGQEHGRGYGPGGGNGPGNATYDSMAEFMGELRNALGVGRQDRAMAEARPRYRDALDGPARQGGKVPGGFDGGRGPDPDRAAYRFDAEETKALIARGWRDPMEHDGFESQAARTRTMMELAKRLGYGERVGAMQAAFGTPYENGIADLEIRFAGARAAGNQTEVERLEGELAAAIASPKPGAGPDSSWATADLDVNHDRRVDVQDLEALDQREPPQARSSPPAN